MTSPTGNTCHEDLVAAPRAAAGNDIGALAPGMAADFVSFPLDDIGLAGAGHDPLAALLLCHVPRVQHGVVGGRIVVRDGELATIDLPRVVERHNRLAARLLG